MIKKHNEFIYPTKSSCFNNDAVLPYGLSINHIESAMQDFLNFLTLINNELNKKGMMTLEQMLMPANFSSIVGEFINSTVPIYCKTLSKNKYHNGHPDLVKKGMFLNDAVQHSHEGIEVKASRYDKSWQGHNPENIWLMVFVFKSSRPNDISDTTPFYFKAVYGAKLEESDWTYAGRNKGSRRTITASVNNNGFEKMSSNWIYKLT